MPTCDWFRADGSHIWEWFLPKQIGPMNGLEGWAHCGHPSKRDLAASEPLGSCKRNSFFWEPLCGATIVRDFIDFARRQIDNVIPHESSNSARYFHR